MVQVLLGRCGPTSQEPVADMEELVSLLNQMLARGTVLLRDYRQGDW